MTSTSTPIGSAALTGIAAPGLLEALVVLRLVQGVGVALVTTCMFAVLADAFPESQGKVMGAAETAGAISHGR
jgi:MFS family permease